MLTSCNAELTGLGIILSGIGDREHAEWLSSLFAKEGLPGIVTPFVPHESYRVVLFGVPLDEFHRIAGRLAIEVEQKPKDAARSL